MVLSYPVWVGGPHYRCPDLPKGFKHGPGFSRVRGAGGHQESVPVLGGEFPEAGELGIVSDEPLGPADGRIPGAELFAGCLKGAEDAIGEERVTDGGARIERRRNLRGPQNDEGPVPGLV